ncbi:hypothetical protein SAMD00019534_048450 [Acytostelium subglobosum LB1]|uniref:hypothetical protein n=1 Tax=Acytostelium subglobosum LB1 TaxID=1410327 RepID=UPI000644FF32|nr:hypothetical protein SAMD00019534_048450 [Acytostelium subglobosum LB1]GAM21670.1 hypothetical protein SAMD00019534_048450 [Acytostelium subglobosum LB1]|eukprot:XP_012755789.1 hypothetical protein SAMD00019534_048450 [Acytostelium subglobosum LB1]
MSTKSKDIDQKEQEDDEMDGHPDNLDQNTMEGGQGSTRLILSIDGGGMRGLIALQLIRYLHDHLGIDLVEKADLVGGTSTGALLTFAKIKGLSYQEIEDTYKSMGKIIFGGFFKKMLNFARYLCFGDMAAYENELQRIFGDGLMGNFHQDHKMFLLTSSLAKDDINYITTIISNYNSKDKDIKLVQGMRATSAAPPYFSSTQFDNKRFVDGGILANNPIVKAKQEADNMYKIGTKLIFVSVGTGHVLNRATSDDSSMSLANTLVNCIANSHSIHKDFKQAVDNNPYISYHRFDVLLDRHIGLDDHSEAAYKAMDQVVKEYLADDKTKEKMDNLKKDLEEMIQPGTTQA